MADCQHKWTEGLKAVFDCNSNKTINHLHDAHSCSGNSQHLRRINEKRYDGKH